MARRPQGRPPAKAERVVLQRWGGLLLAPDVDLRIVLELVIGIDRALSGFTHRQTEIAATGLRWSSAAGRLLVVLTWTEGLAVQIDPPTDLRAAVRPWAAQIDGVCRHINRRLRRDAVQFTS